MLRLSTRSPALDDALNLIYEVREFGNANGEPLPVAGEGAAEEPNAEQTTGQPDDAEYRRLLEKAHRGQLTPEEDGRRTEIVNARLIREG